MKSKNQIKQMAKRLGVFRCGKLNAPRRILRELEEEGVLEHPSRGVYRVADMEPSVHHSLVMASVSAPKGVACLLTALRFHGIGTQNPGDVWLTIPIRAHKPKVDYPPIRFTRATGRSYSEGVEFHMVGGKRIPVYSVAKTIADCFKYRNQVGIDVALEALKDAIRQRKANIDELWKYGKIDRVSRIMQPYLEAIQ